MLKQTSIRLPRFVSTCCIAILVLGLILAGSSQPSAARTQQATQAATQAAADDQGVLTVTGTFKSTNQFVPSYATEPYVGLLDLTAFVKRDYALPLPYNDMTIAGFVGDITQGATYTMPLPAAPRGTINDVGHGKGGKGVEIFVTDFDANIGGDPFLSPVEFRGWSNANDSLLFDPGTNEVVSGKLLVWSPDDQEMFPSNFGADGKLFTADDPVTPIAKGWTMVDLSVKPFKQVRSATVQIPILEGLGANNDLSKLSYTQAFDALVKDLRIRYPFTEYKKINWNAISNTIRPMVAQAEKDKDQTAFNVAMLHFAAQFHDGHLSAQPPQNYFVEQNIGGLGISLGQTDDGTVIARAVLDNLPAASAGIQAGAKITAWNGKPIEQALSSLELLFEPESSPIPTRLKQLLYITRSPVGTKVSITYQNSGANTTSTANLTSVEDRQSFGLYSLEAPSGPTDLPLTEQVLPSGIGYIKLDTFETDPVLLTHMWEYTLKKFNDQNVPSLIIDVRGNGGGLGVLADYLSGSFYSQEFLLNQTFQATKDGQFLPGAKDIVDASPVQWTKPVAVLIGPDCASACEIFSAEMAHDPKHLMVGRYPTGGIEASVEAWTLPGGIYFQAPTARFQTPDGKIFLEGVGVVPNVKVPVTAESLLATDDQELPAAQKALAAAH